MIRKLVRLVRDDEGQGMIEYGLIVAGIALVAMLTLTPLGTAVKDLFSSASTKMAAPQ